MIINFKLFVVLCAAITLAIAFVVFRLGSKNKKYVRGGFIAFFTAMFVFVGAMMMNARAYIVKNTSEIESVVVYGAPEYKMSNGNVLKLDVPLQKCILVNDSPEELVVEKTVYAFSGYKNAKDLLVEAYSTRVIKTMSVDYFFDNRPPKSIVSDNTRKELRFWVRTRQDYEAEYGALNSAAINKIEEALRRRKK
jgi:hypothetical protein